MRKIWDELEEGLTAEAEFTQALDSFMPILHNYQTKGLQWQRLGVTAEQVLERNKRVAKGSEILWGYIRDMVKKAIEKGYLKEK